MPPPDTTQLLLASRAGDRQAFDSLFALIYDELRRIASYRLRRHGAGETVSTTVLVHETYLRLVDQTSAAAADRAHFLALASRAMRFILVDHARAAAAQKRGGGAPAVTLEAVELPAANQLAGNLLALDQALDRLREFSERQCQLVEYRFFGGLNYEEIADVMGTSVRTVKRDWTRARAWLYTYMQTAA